MGGVRRSSRIAYRTIDGEVAVVTVDDRKLHLLNEVGTLIFENVAEPASTLDDLTARILAEFDVTQDKARADCQTFCQELVQRKILEWVD